MWPQLQGWLYRGRASPGLWLRAAALGWGIFPHRYSTGTVSFTWDSSSLWEICQNSAKFSLEGENLFLKILFKAKHSRGWRISRQLRTENGKELQLFLITEICQFCPVDKNLTPCPISECCCFLWDNSLYNINHNNEIQLKAGVCWFWFMYQDDGSMFEHTGSKAAVSSCQCHAGKLSQLPLFSKGIVQLSFFPPLISFS